MRNKASLFNQGLWNLENKELSRGRCITTTSAFESLVYTTTWANPGLRAWAPWSLWSPKWKRRGFISESLPWGTAGWGSRICLSMSVCLCVSLSLSFLLRELKAKADSGKLDFSDAIQNSVPIKCLKSGVKKEDSGFELWHRGGYWILLSLSFSLFWKQMITGVSTILWLEGNNWGFFSLCHSEHLLRHLSWC